jgi:predicted DNA binding CopG/RHH family protein
MSRLPKTTAKSLLKEAHEWDKTIANESPEQVENLLNEAEVFKVPRPPRQPVSLRLDPFDLSMVKRIARKKGIPHTQLIALWLHERIETERGLSQ